MVPTVVVSSPQPGWDCSWALVVRGGSGQRGRPGWDGWRRSPAPFASGAPRHPWSAASCWTDCAERGRAAWAARSLKETAGCDLRWRRKIAKPHFVSIVQYSLLISAVVYEHAEIYEGLTHSYTVKLPNTMFLFKEKFHHGKNVEEKNVSLFY